ncbi:hypothetical protein [Caudoviricetes sp.]|nr:MAG: hypothetical protein [Podoviridae sp. ct2cs2]UOF77532.1 hypothetical protein [Caudoviricetes sp.]
MFISIPSKFHIDLLSTKAILLPFKLLSRSF